MFGGGAGHIADMMARYKTNMTILTKKRYFNKHTGKYEHSTERMNKSEPKASPEQLAKLRSEQLR